MDESGAWAEPPPHRVCRKQGLWSCPAAGSWVERQRRLEASPCYDWSGIQVFLCASAPNQGKEEARGPSSGRHSGEDAPGAMGCQACHHDNSCSWEARGGGEWWKRPSPMQMLPGREEASWAACPPTLLCHPIPLFTKAEQYARHSLKRRL